MAPQAFPPKNLAKISQILKCTPSFRQITYLVISLVKVLLSRNFCQKLVRVNFRNFHSVYSICYHDFSTLGLEHIALTKSLPFQKNCYKWFHELFSLFFNEYVLISRFFGLMSFEGLCRRMWRINGWCQYRREIVIPKYFFRFSKILLTFSWNQFGAICDFVRFHRTGKTIVSNVSSAPQLISRKI